MEFSFSSVPTLYCACGALARAAEFAQQHSLQRIFIVVDPGVVTAGLLQPLLDSLLLAGCMVQVFDGVEPDPGEQLVAHASAQAREFGAHLVLGMGGGSAMDVAKLAAYFANASETLRAVIGVEQARGKRLPLVLIPTTAGTGSEVTPIAVVTLLDQTKGAVVSSRLLPDIAILDAELTRSLPALVTAHTGVDAIVHAIEAYTSVLRKNPLSDALALRAVKMLYENIRTVFSDGSDLPARQNMLLGACLAGMAFANAPVAAVHALAYPLGGIFHLPHGLSNAVVLTEVLRFNRDVALPHYAELGRAIGAPLTMSDADACDYLIVSLERLLADLQIDTRLAAYGIGPADLDRLAEDALRQQRLLVNNMRAVTLADARRIYANRLAAV